MQKSKRKDFWDVSLNIVKGCGKKPPCPYCYGRRMVKRLGYAETVAEKEVKFKYGKEWLRYEIANVTYFHLIDQIKNFKPTFFEYVLAQELRKKPTMYFFSMSDPASWKQEWYERIAAKIAENMQHTFVILTKNPHVYEKWHFPHNTITGITITNNELLKKWQLAIDSIERWHLNNKLLICIEPIISKIDISILETLNIDWLHVGQESGNRAGRVIVTREMIEPFFELKDIPVFMKDNLAGIVPGRELRKEYPEL